MKTIIISSFHPLISRNILQTDVLPCLLSRPEARIVLVVPEGKTEYFRQNFGGERVRVEGVNVPKEYFEELLTLVSFGLVGVENHIVCGWKTDGFYLKYYLTRAIYAFFSKLFFLQRFLRFIARHSFDTKVFDFIFRQYKPDLIVATDSFGREDRVLLMAGKRAGIRTAGMIRSWDNPTTKGVFLSLPDLIISPNTIIKEELVAIHHCSADKIMITGIPHYDSVGTPPNVSREEFCKEMGLDPQKKIVLFAPGGKILYKHDTEILRLLKRNLEAERFATRVQFLVRLPPGDRVDVAPIINDERFVVDDPGTNVTGRKKERELSSRDSQRLYRSLFYSDAVITLVSTMAIDGMVFDKPVIVLNFDPRQGLSDTVKKFARYEHFKKFLGSGMVTISYSEEEFLRQLNAYLEDPTSDASRRRTIRELYAYRLDGRSGQRVADCLLRQLD